MRTPPAPTLPNPEQLLQPGSEEVSEDTAKGNRPSFSHAARPEPAESLYEHFCATLRELGVEVETGVFGVRMQLELVNDGPVTIVLDVGGS